MILETTWVIKDVDNSFKFDSRFLWNLINNISMSRRWFIYFSTTMPALWNNLPFKILACWFFWKSENLAFPECLKARVLMESSLCFCLSWLRTFLVSMLDSFSIVLCGYYCFSTCLLPRIIWWTTLHSCIIKIVAYSSMPHSPRSSRQLTIKNF